MSIYLGETPLANTGYDNVKLTGDQTIADVKTFSSSPILPTPATSDNSTKGATTAFVKAQGYLGTADLATCHVVTQTYINGTSWYRIYDDGWIEQGSTLATSSSDNPTIVTFLKAFANTNYTLNATVVSQTDINAGISTRTTTSFGVATSQPGTQWALGRTVSWYACGKGA